jgi:hypothetical protein
MDNSRISWHKYILELLVVFLGITLAFMMDSWKETRKDVELEQKYLHSFQSDLQKDAEGLTSIVNDCDTTLTILDNFIPLLGTDDLIADSTGTVLNKMASYNSFYPELATYESIKNSGNLGLISNYELKEEFVKYYQMLHEKNLVDEVYALFLSEYILPFFFAQVDMIRGQYMDQNTVEDKEFSNLVLGFTQLLQQKRDIYNDILEANKALAESLKQEIELYRE